MYRGQGPIDITLNQFACMYHSKKWLAVYNNPVQKLKGILHLIFEKCAFLPTVHIIILLYVCTKVQNLSYIETLSGNLLLF